MMLSPKARVDAIPSVLVSADDVSASHGGTVGELDEALDLLHAEPRPRPRQRGARDRRGLLRAAALRAAGRAAGGAGARKGRRRSSRPRARTSRRTRPADEQRGDATSTPPPPTAVPTPLAKPVAALDVRGDFPILARSFGGRPLVYLDSASTSQKPRVVIDARRGAPAARTTPTCTAGSTRSRRRPTRPMTTRASGVAAFTGGGPEHDDLHEERDRGDQPRRVRLGPRERAARAMRCWSPRWSTTRTSCRGRCCARRRRDAALPGGRRAGALLEPGAARRPSSNAAT